MKTILERPLCAIIFFGWLFTISGCATRMGGRLYESEQWRQQKGSLGKVALVIARPDDKPASDDKDPHAKPDAVESAIKSALTKLPGTTVLDGVATVPPSTAMGDREAIALGKSHGAQSVCVVSIARIGNLFSIGFLFVPTWSCESYALYSIRLLDVQSGELLANGITSRRDGGIYQFARWNIFLKDLQSDLRAPQSKSNP